MVGDILLIFRGGRSTSSSCQARIHTILEEKVTPGLKKKLGLVGKNHQPACQWVEIALFSGNLPPNGVSGEIGHGTSL